MERGGTAERQEWSEARRFPGRIVMEKRESALITAKEWKGPDAVWTDGSRQENGAVGAACVWRTQEGWTGRQYTVFVDSTSATRARDDDLGPGQRFAVATIEVCSRTIAIDNSVTIRWVPAHRDRKSVV